jgi:hypothetical protein
MSSSTNPTTSRPKGTSTKYRSFVVSNVDDKETLLESTICAHCPAAIWYQQESMNCFCSIMKKPTWFDKVIPITMCDAREAAVALEISKDVKAG